MKRIVVIAVAIAAVSAFLSCSTTGFMGLASEKAVIAMDEKKSAEIEELKIQIERLDSLSEELEEALAKVEQAKKDAAQAVELARSSEEESADIEKKMEEMLTMLKKLERKIKDLPRETIDEIISILKEYLDDSGDEDEDDWQIYDAETEETATEAAVE